MTKIKVPLIKYMKINNTECVKNTYIVCDTTCSSGIVDYIDIIGLCRTKSGKAITTLRQACVVLDVNDNELIDIIKKYKPSELNMK